MNKWTQSLPVYVTRQNGEGGVGTYSVAAWLGLTIMLLIYANLLGWGIYGLVTLVEKVV